MSGYWSALCRMMKNDSKRRTRYGFTPTVFPLELFHWFLKIRNLMKPARCSIRLRNRPGVGELTMADPSKLSRNVLPYTVVPNAVEVLERLRDSYKGLSEGEALTGVDRAVLVAVEIALKHVARAV
jgi:hypothetical protein